MNDTERKMIEQIRQMAESLLGDVVKPVRKKKESPLQKKAVDFLKESKEPLNLYQMAKGMGNNITIRQLSNALSLSRKTNKKIKRLAKSTYQYVDK